VWGEAKRERTTLGLETVARLCRESAALVADQGRAAAPILKRMAEQLERVDKAELRRAKRAA
jgi:hypothetical protein